MNIEEKAKDIVRNSFLIHLDLREGYHRESILADQFPKLENLISNALREAYEEGKRNTVTEATLERYGIAMREELEWTNRRRGYREGLEDATKSLEALYVMKGSENDGMVFIPHAQEKIRALTKDQIK